jgi:Fe-S-cluster containining protein
MKSLPVFACDGCGACCRYFPVIVSNNDALFEPQIALLGKPHLQDSTALYLNHGELSPCFFLNDRNRCKIYPTRPQVCREFVAGASQCQEAREKLGFPLLTAYVTE